MLNNLPIWPPEASEFAVYYDWLFIAELLLSIFFTLLVVSLVIVFCVRYRRGTNADRSHPHDHNMPLEIGTIGTLLVLSLITFAWAAKLYADVYTPPDNAMEIFVIGKQWMWHLQHSNGVRENNELHVPVGQAVKLTMISQDVIHDFSVPAFRIKRDVIPGNHYTSVWFTPTQIGKYHLFCDQYCGTQHSEMAGFVYVMDPTDYQNWLTKAVAGQAGPGETTSPPPPTMEAAGAKLYDQLACGTCHDPDMGRGPTLSGLYRSQVTLSDGRRVPADEDYIRKSIIDPSDDVVAKYQQVMPSYKDQLTEDQLLQLIAYIKSLAPPTNTTPEPAVRPTGAPAIRTRAQARPTGVPQ